VEISAGATAKQVESAVNAIKRVAKTQADDFKIILPSGTDHSIPIEIIQAAQIEERKRSTKK
jgi:hypothetical protein